MRESSFCSWPILSIMEFQRSMDLFMESPTSALTRTFCFEVCSKRSARGYLPGGFSWSWRVTRGSSTFLGSTLHSLLHLPLVRSPSCSPSPHFRLSHSAPTWAKASAQQSSASHGPLRSFCPGVLGSATWSRSRLPLQTPLFPSSFQTSPSKHLVLLRTKAPMSLVSSR